MSKKYNPSGMKDTSVSPWVHERVKRLDSREEVEFVLDLLDRGIGGGVGSSCSPVGIQACRRSLRAGIHYTLFDCPNPNLNALFYTENAMFWGGISPLRYNNNCLVAEEYLWRSTGSDGIHVFRMFQNWADHAGAMRISVSTFWGDKNDKIHRFMRRMGYNREYVTYSRDLVRGT